MKNVHSLISLIALSLMISLSSCSSTKQVAQRLKAPKIQLPKTALKTPKLKSPKLPQWKKPSLAFLNPQKLTWKDLRAGKRVPIVEVRDKDLKKQKSGEQLYLAYNQKKKRYGYYSGENGKTFIPVDFDPSNLPEGDESTITSIGLLPPLSPGGNPIAAGGPAGDLPPVDIPEIPLELQGDGKNLSEQKDSLEPPSLDDISPEEFAQPLPDPVIEE